MYKITNEKGRLVMLSIPFVNTMDTSENVANGIVTVIANGFSSAFISSGIVIR